MKLLRTIAFALVGILVGVLAVATCVEKVCGIGWVSAYVYGAPWFVALWGVLGGCGLLYVWRRRLRGSVLLLHLSFALILLGALVTHLFGLQGSIHLRQDSEVVVRTFTATDGEEHALPFGLRLEAFRVDYYPGTVAPMDYVSRIIVEDEADRLPGEVSMNRIFRHRHYRFYQSRYDSDGLGTTLAVSHDPWGIGLTYAGYALLLLSVITFFFDKRSGFRTLLHHPLLRRVAICFLLLGGGVGGLQAAEKPRVLPCETAEAFGRLYVYYNDRICPLQTLAKDFTVKLCGKPTYRGLTSEQVFTGWFFYYDSWKEEPCIRIKNRDVQRRLGISEDYARLVDFAGLDGYKLGAGQDDITNANERHAVNEANEKFSLVSQVVTGSIWKIYPYVAKADTLKEGDVQLEWYSLADRLPVAMPADEARFLRNCMNYVGEQVARRDFAQVETLLGKLRKFQVREAGGWLPSDMRIAAERCYNQLNNSRPLAMASLLLGILTFIGYCRCMVKRRQMPRVVSRLLRIGMGALFVFLCFVLMLRGVVSGHIPMSNGHETMQLMAACSALLTFFFYRKLPTALSFGYLLCGLSLLVSMMGEANPQVTPLMPVLSSPLLSLHVMVIMAAYALLAFMMLSGVLALLLHLMRGDVRREEVERLAVLSRLLLYPAVFLLAVGIFVGAVWANVSWGRYWGWDPKEVWALITFLVYTLALHPASLPWFRKSLALHAYLVGAFFCVLITYFGVNFFLGGMHSYA